MRIKGRTRMAQTMRTGGNDQPMSGNRRSRRAEASRNRGLPTPAVCPDLSGSVALVHPKSGDVLVTDVPGFTRRCGYCKTRGVVFCLGDSPASGGVVLLCAACVSVPEVEASLLALAERGKEEADLVASLMKWATS